MNSKPPTYAGGFEFYCGGGEHNQGKIKQKRLGLDFGFGGCGPGNGPGPGIGEGAGAEVGAEVGARAGAGAVIGAKAGAGADDGPSGTGPDSLGLGAAPPHVPAIEQKL